MKCNCDTQSRIVDCVFCFLALLSQHISLKTKHLLSDFPDPDSYCKNSSLAEIPPSVLLFFIPEARADGNIITLVCSINSQAPEHLFPIPNTLEDHLRQSPENPWLPPFPGEPQLP